MRRIFAIVIIALVVFLAAYGIVPPVKAAVDGFMLNTMGPTAFNALHSMYAFVLTTVGVSGFAVIVLIFGFFGGVIAHFGWVKADWKMRRWGHTRTAKDLGATPVAPVRSTTPAGATTRPEPAAEPTPEPEPVPEETTEETV